MSNTVFCRKYQQDLPGLDRAPYPGPKGQDIFENVSKKAWQEWLEQQTMLINERHLNMMDVEARAFLQEQFDKFIVGDDYEKADGYVPEGK